MLCMEVIPQILQSKKSLSGSKTEKLLTGRELVMNGFTSRSCLMSLEYKFLLTQKQNWSLQPTRFKTVL